MGTRLQASYVATTSVYSSGKPTGQYHIYTTAWYFDLCHRWATICGTVPHFWDGLRMVPKGVLILYMYICNLTS